MNALSERLLATSDRVRTPEDVLAAIQRERARRAGLARLAKEAAKVIKENRSLAGFIRNAWHIVEPGTEFVPNWHIDAICAHLEAVTRGEIIRLIINVPPGSMKSLIVSVFWPAWEWAMGYRSMRYLCTSYAAEFTVRDADRFRQIVMSDWYRELYPDIWLRGRGIIRMTNNMNGGRESRAFGSLTGARGDRVIIDDPHSTITAESDAERGTTIKIFRESVPKRVNDPIRSAIVIIMQRLHTDDVTGTAIAADLGYVLLRLPMEFEPEDACATGVMWTYKGKRQPFRDPRTVAGELLDPIRNPRDVVERDKKAMGAFAVAGQFQQRPVPRGGGLFERSWFDFVREVPRNRIVRSCRAWDFAASERKPGTKPDWTAGLLAHKDSAGTFYVEGVDRFQRKPLGVHIAVTGHAKADPTNTTIRIPQDPGAAGKEVGETYVKELAGYNVVVKPVSGSKVQRAEPSSRQAEAGNVKIVRTGDPARDAWIEPFLAELETFPLGANDDQVDAFADAVNELTLGTGYTLDNL